MWTSLCHMYRLVSIHKNLSVQTKNISEKKGSRPHVNLKQFILLHSNTQELLTVQMAKVQTKMETG